MDLFLAISTWIIVIFNVRVAVWGNPLKNVLDKHDDETLRQAEVLLDTPRKEEWMGENPKVGFLRSFFRSFAIEFVLFILEIVLLFIFALARGDGPYSLVGMTSLVLLTKNILVLFWSIYSCWLLGDADSKSYFIMFRDLPTYFFVIDRCSSMISAVGFVLLFMTTVGMLP